MALTDTAHQAIQKHFSHSDLSDKVAIDATCGNGHDTVFLAQMGFHTVLGFDIQKHAIEITQQRLLDHQQNNTKLIHDGHENLEQYIQSEIECAMFNLGYMPNTHKTITTTESTSIEAIKISLNHLSETGLVSILCYPGHPQGAQETNAIQSYLDNLGNRWQVDQILTNYPGPRAPILYLIKY